MGVDISAPPGTPILAITREKLYSKITNFFRDPKSGIMQALYNFQELDAEGQPTGRYNYASEQITPTVQVGQEVQAGQQVGVVAPVGSALEFGFSTESGQTLAQATTGYTEGEVTTAGTQYQQQVIQGGIVRPGGDVAGSTNPPGETVSGSSTGGPAQIFQNWSNYLETPRTAPPGTKNPLQWFLASFTGNWDALGTAAPDVAANPVVFRRYHGHPVEPELSRLMSVAV